MEQGIIYLDRHWAETVHSPHVMDTIHMQIIPHLPTRSTERGRERLSLAPMPPHRLRRVIIVCLYVIGRRASGTGGST
jgi:hypothetical protein